MRIAALAFFGLCIPIVAVAQPPAKATPRSGTVCLRQDMVWGWKVADNKTLIVTDKVRRAYKVSLKPGCLDLKWPMHLGFQSLGGSRLSCLTGNDYVIVPPQAGLPAQRCLISDVTAYVPPK